MGIVVIRLITYALFYFYLLLVNREMVFEDVGAYLYGIFLLAVSTIIYDSSWENAWFYVEYV